MIQYLAYAITVTGTEESVIKHIIMNKNALQFVMQY